VQVLQAQRHRVPRHQELTPGAQSGEACPEARPGMSTGPPQVARQAYVVSPNEGKRAEIPKWSEM